jgi:hypothetical protein
VTDLAHPTIAGFCFDAFDQPWALADPAACIVCGAAAWCRDPRGRPRHRVDCRLAPPSKRPPSPVETVDDGWVARVEAADPASEDIAERIRAQTAALRRGMTAPDRKATHEQRIRTDR